MLRKKSTVLFQVDATKLHGHPDLKQKKFDIILFTFPHTGTPNCSPKSIEDNKKLIRDFLVSAQQILANDGKIILTLKTSQPYDRWTFPSFAGYEIEPKSQHAFNAYLFPGYVHRSTKRTTMGTIVKNGNAKTYVFGRKRKRQDSDTEEDGDDDGGGCFQPLTSFKLHTHFLPFDDNDIESYVVEILSAQAQQKSVNVLDIRCLFPEAICPDTRQLNRVLHRMESAQMLRKGPPKACNQKPTWKLVTE